MGLGLAALAIVGACTRGDGSATEDRRDDPSVTFDARLISSLEAFDACDDLLAYLRTEGAKVVGPYGFDGGSSKIALEATAGATTDVRRDAAAPTPGAATADQSAAPQVAGTDYSATNVQEEGVDEPDLVKTDGRKLATIAGGRLRLVDLTAPLPRAGGSLALDASGYLGGELLLVGDRVVVLRPVTVGAGTDGQQDIAPPPAGIAADAVRPSPGFRPGPPRTAVTVVDGADVDAPKVLSELVVDGDLVAARAVKGVARIVLRSGPPDLPFLYPSGSASSVEVAAEANRKAVSESSLDDWLPSYRQDGSDERRLTDCHDVTRPREFSGVGMLSVFTVDAGDPRPGPAATIVGAGETVYASTGNLYVSSVTWQPAPDAPQNPPADQQAPSSVRALPSVHTDLHKFAIDDPVRTTYVASGRVDGRLLSSFSLSEHAGDLRVATTDDVAQESAVTVLRQRDQVLEPVGRVGGLGKTERIYAVRFLGDRGYVVTFRQTDPLYVIDLADAEHPRVAGELKIPGYSAYLHPAGDHRLIGVGQDASDQGRVQGTKLSLFDVSDPSAPKLLGGATLASSQSEAEFDHHAFLFWPKTGLVVLPVQSYGDGSSGAVGFTIGDRSVEEVGRIRHRGGDAVRRSVVVGDRLLTLSELGLETSDLSTLAERGWLAY
jgi:hypothetical protein